jgi:protein-arginine kinase activator protein McsA
VNKLTINKWSIDDLKEAHKFCIRNFESIKNSHKTGCFYCCKIFDGAEIIDWITEDDGGKTCLCPECPIDSVIGDASGYPITIEFLNAMNEYYF